MTKIVSHNSLFRHLGEEIFAKQNGLKWNFLNGVPDVQSDVLQALVAVEKEEVQKQKAESNQSNQQLELPLSHELESLRLGHDERIDILPIATDNSSVASLSYHRLVTKFLRLLQRDAIQEGFLDGFGATLHKNTSKSYALCSSKFLQTYRRDCAHVRKKCVTVVQK